MPYLSIVGTGSTPACSKKHQARFAALHQQHGSSTLPCASGSNIARYNLSGKAPVVQPVVVSRDGMALSPVSRSAHTPQVRENYYRFAVRTETDS